jgi:nucleolar protein 15
MAIQERTLDEHRRLVGRIMKRDEKRRKKIEAAGLDYECPEFVRALIIFLLLILD